MSGWTEERVEQLKKLWLQGWTASQIAKELGAVTRNAVIGKIHRLDLVARQSPKMTPPAGFSASFMGAAAKKTNFSQPISVKPAPVSGPSTYQSPAVAFAEPARRGAQIGAGSVSLTGSFGKSAGLVSGQSAFRSEQPLDRLTGAASARQCQWPVGDPRSAGFHFCGCQPLEALPYCGEHAKLAYQPSAKNRRVNVGGDLHATGTPDEREISIRA